MSTSAGPNIVEDGLVLYLDAANEKSFRGVETVNYASWTNARKDQSYSPYVATTSGTWQQKHPDAITVYNSGGTNISAYVNTGVTDWTNTYHAIWTYDDNLEKPVVTMRDFDGIWKSKTSSLGLNFSNLGMTVGSKYTISWLQWVDNIDKALNVGLYTRNSSGTNNFWDGLSGGSITSKNTKTNTWERVYHTFTVTSNWDLTIPYNAIYMYGHYYVRATIKIADLQFELKDSPTTFSENQYRGSTVETDGGFIDISGNSNNGELVNSLSESFLDKGSILFNGVGDKITIPYSETIKPTSLTLEAWFKPSSLSGWTSVFQYPFNSSSHTSPYFEYGIYVYYTGALHTRIDGVATGYNGTNVVVGQWNHLLITYDEVTGEIGHWVNGTLVGTYTKTAGPISYNSNNPIYIGANASSSEIVNGNISSIKIYNRALSKNEILNNFNAQRGRYGI